MTFRYAKPSGLYCPPGLPCTPYENADAGFVVVDFADTASAVASVSLVSDNAVTATRVGGAALSGPWS